MQRNRFLVTAAAVLATAVASGACSNNSGKAPDMSSMSTSAPSSPSMSAGPTPAQAHNDADVAFAQGMIPHHQQAIEMSDILLTKQGIDPRVVSLANQIKAAQGPEIQQMQGWFADWGVAAPPTAPGTGMPGHETGSMGGGRAMSEQDMAALRGAQGAEASRLFLIQMTAHHKSAIAMAQTEQTGGQFAAAVKLARSIISSQQKEIENMQQILATL